MSNNLPLSKSESIWFPESLYNSWLAVSVVLMTTSLLFYHMTQKDTLAITARPAAMIAILFMVLSITITIGSLVPYYQRISNVTDHNDDPQAIKEKHYKIFYTIVGSIFILIELIVAFYIVRNVIK